MGHGPRQDRNGAPRSPKLGETLKAFALNYVLTFLAGVAGALLVALFSPVRAVILSLYTPLDFFLETYFYAWGCFLLASFIYWIIVLRFVKWPSLQLVVPYVIALTLLSVAGLMRSETLLPNVIGAQFVCFAASMIMLGEALIIHAIMLMRNFMRESGLI